MSIGQEIVRGGGILHRLHTEHLHIQRIVAGEVAAPVAPPGEPIRKVGVAVGVPPVAEEVAKVGVGVAVGLPN